MNIIETFPVSRPLLSSFSKEDLARLSVVTYPAKTVIVSKGRILNTVYFILNGTCSVMKELSSGNTIIGYHISTLNHIGLNGILSPNSRCFSTIISVTDLTVLEMSKSDFLHFHNKYPSFALFLLQHTSLARSITHCRFPITVNLILLARISFTIWLKNMKSIWLHTRKITTDSSRLLKAANRSATS